MLFDMIPETKYRRLDNGCILWTGRLNSTGRPQPTILGSTLFRALCWEKHGPPPTPLHHAAHLCHNGLCINADHSEWQAEEVNNPTIHANEFPSNERKREQIVIKGVSVTIKERVSNKGDGRFLKGWCAVLRMNNRTVKSGAYNHKQGAINWAKAKLGDT